ncbi:MAG: MBL fold metallo-hydrolase [bacterium]|nr:MBL fold metallo-hydrolase [bacterium]
MQIMWKGQACFVLTASPNKETVRLVIDPYDSSIGLKVPSMEADLVLVSHDHHDHNNIKAIKGDPVVVSGPGEYDVKGVFVRGISSWHDEEQGKKRGLNTIYVIEAEDMRVCHLGDLGQSELTPEQVEDIGDVDILMVPVGGVYTIAAKEAAKITAQIEPRAVIPMHYLIPKLSIKLEKADEFLKLMGHKGAEKTAKLNIKRKDLTSEETQVVVMEP